MKREIMWRAGVALALAVGAAARADEPEVRRTWHDGAETQVKLECPLVNGVPHGLAVEYGRPKDGYPGVVRKQIPFVAGKTNGTVRVFDLDGRLEALQSFEAGVRQGMTTNYYPGGKQVRAVEEYRAGGLVLQTIYSGDRRLAGKITAVTPFDGEQPHGVSKSFNPRNGNVQAEVPFEHGKLHGTERRYAGDGKMLTAEVEYEHGNKHGTETRYDHYGKVQAVLVHEKGEVVHEKRLHPADGSPRYEAHYRAGQKDGVEKEYFPNGDLKSETVWKADKRDGVQKVYTAGNKRIWEKPYKDDRLHGLVKAFWPTGVVQSEETYEDGKLVKSLFYDEKGVLKP